MKKPKLINNFRKSRKALSPAIAIALLLGITIALVAAVGYSTSMVTPTIESSPQAAFAVSIQKNGGAMADGTIKIKELSGSAIPTQNLKLRFVVNGIATETIPNQNNTFYWRWYLFNPVDTYFSMTSPLDHNDPGTKELDNTEATTIGIQFTNAQSETDTPALKNWLAPATVRLYNETAGAWTSPVSQDVAHPILGYRDAWHNYPGDFANYTIANPDNTRFTKVQITNSLGLSIEIPLDNNDDMGDVEGGDAVYVRLCEYGSPFLYKLGTLPTNDYDISFGNFAIQPGETMKAVGSDSCPVLISNWADINPGDVVQAYLIYTASNQVIWQGDVVVQ